MASGCAEMETADVQMGNHIYIFISFFFICLSLAVIAAHASTLSGSRVFVEIIDKQTEMPDEVNAVAQIKACLGQKCQKVPPCLGEIYSYLLSFCSVCVTDGALNMTWAGYTYLNKENNTKYNTTISTCEWEMASLRFNW